MGNSPEFMPLDNSLNNDIIQAHEYHCALSYHLPYNHLAKFSTKTPNWVQKGISRLVDLKDLTDVSGEVGVPSSARIIQDCDRALDSMETVLWDG